MPKARIKGELILAYLKDFFKGKDGLDLRRILKLFDSIHL